MEYHCRYKIFSLVFDVQKHSHYTHVAIWNVYIVTMHMWLFKIFINKCHVTKVRETSSSNYCLYISPTLFQWETPHFTCSRASYVCLVCTHTYGMFNIVWRIILNSRDVYFHHCRKFWSIWYWSRLLNLKS